MKLFGSLLVIQLVLSAAGAQEPVTTPTPLSGDEVKELIATTYERNDYETLKAPYHLRANYQTFTPDGIVSGSGSIERWASEKGPVKTVTRFGDHSMTEYAVRQLKLTEIAPGARLYTDDGFGGNIMLYFAMESLLYPTLPRLGIIHRQVTPTLISVAGDMLDCGSVVLEIGPAAYPARPNDRFCVSRSTGDLVLRHRANLTIRYGNFSSFADKSIPRMITGTQGSRIRFRIEVEQLDQSTLPDAQLTAPTDASVTSPEPNIWATKPEETTPAHVDKVRVPAGLEDVHASGQVDLYVLISHSGKVTDVETLYAATPELANYATQLAYACRYKPIVRNGKPLQEIAHSYFTFRF